MTIPIDWDPTPEGTKKLPALVVPPIPGVLPFEGAHNPLTRSNTARRVSMVIPTVSSSVKTDGKSFPRFGIWSAL